MRFRHTCAVAAIAVASMIGFGSGAPAEAAAAGNAARALAPLVDVVPDARQGGLVEKTWHRGRPHRVRPRHRWRPRYRWGPPVYAPRPRYRVRPRARGFPRAHFAWCNQRYRSYRAYDNSFQPYNGPRRPCISPYIR